jgi:hypothetical protein
MDLMWLYLLAYAVFLLASGYLLPFLKTKSYSRTLGWVIAVVTVGFSTWVTIHQPSLLRMIVIVYMQLLSMKILVAVETYTSENKLSIFQWLAFALGWFGMRPVLFEKLPSPPRDYRKLLLKGISRIVIGLLFVYLSFVIAQFSWAHQYFFPQLLLLVGVSLTLHFGILNLSTALWRAMGVDVSELFRAPYKSKSLKEFWGKRWNIAFSEMTARIAYRPLRDKIGTEAAVVLSFLLSGLLHEIAISFPVNAGYGLPLIYFGIHAIAMQMELKLIFIQRIINHKFWSHVWVMGLLIVPMPLLFHEAFMANVLVPLGDLLVNFD